MEGTMKRSVATTRSAFTLVEVLVVVGILAILMTFLVLAMGGILGGAREASTQTAILKIDTVIQARLDAISLADDDIKAAAKQVAARSPLNADAAEFIIRKNLLRRILPQRVEDFYGFNRADDSGGADDVPLPSSFNAGSSSGSEPLFLAITQMKSIEILPDGKSITLPVLLVDDMDAKHIADNDSDGNKEFVDDWGNPIQFYLWPTRLIRPGGSGGISSEEHAAASLLIPSLPPLGTSPLPANQYTHQLNQDSADVSGLLAMSFSSSVNVSGSGAITAFTVEVFNEANYHSANTYSVPLLVSAGADGELGLSLPNASNASRLCQPLDIDSGTAGIQPDFEALGDNLTNRQQ